MTLLQYLAKRTSRGKSYARHLLSTRQVTFNQNPSPPAETPVTKFDHITAAGITLQSLTRRVILLHKPSGILSATSDPVHKTVIDLIPHLWAKDLHLAGRLDRSTTGLVILTNDSSLSEKLTDPSAKTPKTYLVHTDKVIHQTAIDKFCAGMPFAKENTRSQPALVTLLSPTSCRLTIYEGLHHQIKRMFLRFDIRVTSLHRESIGTYHLSDLAEGEWRESN